MTSQKNQLSEIYLRPSGEFITVREAATILVLPDSLPGVKATTVPLLKRLTRQFTKLSRWASYFFNSKNYQW